MHASRESGRTHTHVTSIGRSCNDPERRMTPAERDRYYSAGLLTKPRPSTAPAWRPGSKTRAPVTPPPAPSPAPVESQPAEPTTRKPMQLMGSFGDARFAPSRPRPSPPSTAPQEAAAQPSNLEHSSAASEDETICARAVLSRTLFPDSEVTRVRAHRQLVAASLYHNLALAEQRRSRGHDSPVRVKLWTQELAMASKRMGDTVRAEQRIQKRAARWSAVPRDAPLVDARTLGASLVEIVDSHAPGASHEVGRSHGRAWVSPVRAAAHAPASRRHRRAPEPPATQGVRSARCSSNMSPRPPALRPAQSAAPRRPNSARAAPSRVVGTPCHPELAVALERMQAIDRERMTKQSIVKAEAQAKAALAKLRVENEFWMRVKAEVQASQDLI